MLVLTLCTVSCSDSTYATAPLGPSTVSAAVPAPGLPTPPPAAQALTVSLSVGRGSPEVGDNISFVASTDTPITSAAWSFGNGATSTTTSGSTAYAYPAIGTFAARVIVTASDGRRATDQVMMTVRRKPSTPGTTPTPPREPSEFAVSLDCTAQPVDTPTPCNVTASYHDATVPSRRIMSVEWDWGDGEADPGSSPANAHPYASPGTYTVVARVTADTGDGIKVGQASSTVAITAGPTTTPLFTASGSGSDVVDLPTTVTRVRITASYFGPSATFEVTIAGFPKVDDVLGTGEHLTTISGIYSAAPGSEAVITTADGVAWTFTEVR